jgi:hypothetical protein
LYSRDSEKREARLSFNVGQEHAGSRFRNEVDLLFDCRPASEVTFRVHDEHGEPTTERSRSVTPRTGLSGHGEATGARLWVSSADLSADAETEQVPSGEYEVEYGRGPEYLRKNATLRGMARRRSGPSRWSGGLIGQARLVVGRSSHHAAGCATTPVHRRRACPDMMRHCLGEDFKGPLQLTWGPCFDYQKQFFPDRTTKVRNRPTCSTTTSSVGLCSHESGHLCLLRLKEQIYPGGESKHHWPTLAEHAALGEAAGGRVRSAFGLGTRCRHQRAPKLRSSFDGIGANEYIVDVTHEIPGPGGKLEPAVDFLSMVDTPYVWELNIWYHTLNVGYRTRISGETDFPCIYGERVGLGRSYVKLDGELRHEDWCEGIRRGPTMWGQQGHPAELPRE